MNLPNGEQADLPAVKLYDYLPSTSHSVGKSKAKFFIDHGFDASNATILESGILTIARNEEVHSVPVSPFGTKYVIDGSIMTPSGHKVNIRTIWIIETSKDKPKFVTAYPQPG